MTPAKGAPRKKAAPRPKKVRGNPRLRDKPPLRKRDELAPGYLVIEHLSRNRYLDVYEVWSEERECRCVAKLNRPHLAKEPYDRRKLVAEARLALRIKHPHIVRAYELLKEPEPILILETLNGETLGYMVEERPRRLTIAEVSYLGLHLCSAIQYLHGLGYLHLDVKPDNIISDAGMAKLIDLSIARPPGHHKGGIGTPDFMSPEQAGGGVLSPATDVWGIGATLFEAATFTPVFVCPSREVLPMLTEPPPEITTRRRGMPKPFSDLVMACLERAPEERPAIAELTRGLAEFAPDQVPLVRRKRVQRRASPRRA